MGATNPRRVRRRLLAPPDCKEQYKKDMKLFRTFAAAAVLAALFVVSANAQQPAAGRPAAAPAQGGSAVVADGKIAIIDTSAFGDPKAGIQRLVAAFNTIDREFKPRRDELDQLRNRYTQILKDIDATKGVSDEKALAAKADQAETLKNDIERRQQDGQRALEKRVQELTNPIFQDIGNALQAFAAQRGITLVFDVSKTGNAMMVVNNAVDITDAFIADYNQRNPASTAAATPAAPASRP